MANKILEIKNLKKSFPTGFSLGIGCLHVNENEIFTLIGPNGSGKSTLIYIINLLLSPDSGSVVFDGEDILAKKTGQKKIRNKMAAVFQEPTLFNTSVYNNLLLGLKLRNMELNDCKDNLDFLLDKLKLKNLLSRSARTLSGGEQQKVCLARALLLNPKILLLDEPLANIDQETKEEFRSVFFEILKQKGITTFYITHDRNEAMIISDYIGVIENGIMQQTGPKEEVFRKPVNGRVAKFVGIETLIEGTVKSCENGVLGIALSGNNLIYSTGEGAKGAKVTVCVRPEDIMLYSSMGEAKMLSTPNIFSGKVKEIRNMGLVKKIEVDCGFLMSAYITNNSLNNLELEPGTDVFAAVNESSVHIF
jgi:tungstate transport system ATP-binding protein